MYGKYFSYLGVLEDYLICCDVLLKILANAFFVNSPASSCKECYCPVQACAMRCVCFLKYVKGTSPKISVQRTSRLLKTLVPSWTCLSFHHFSRGTGPIIVILVIHLRSQTHLHAGHRWMTNWNILDMVFAISKELQSKFKQNWTALSCPVFNL